MASRTKKTWSRRERKRANAGHKRKSKLSRKSTLSEVELFAPFGEPGKPAPRAR